jgi:membrane-associated phospholipid phosphatase
MIACAGCAPYPNAPPGATGILPPVVQRYENPSLVPANNHDALWEVVVDVVDDYFRIDREEPVRVIGNVVTEGQIETFPTGGATLLEPWRGDSADHYERLESTLQSVQRRAVVRVTPAPQGFLVEVQVFKELEDVVRPEHATAGAATLRYDNSLTRVINPVGEQQITRGWIPLGRDPALEQRMLGDLERRVGRLVAPSSLPGMTPGAAPCSPAGSCGPPLSFHPASTDDALADDSLGPLVDLRGDGSIESTCSDAATLHYVVARPSLDMAGRLPATDCSVGLVTLEPPEVTCEPPGCTTPLPMLVAAQRRDRSSPAAWTAGVLRDVGGDFCHFYSPHGLLWTGGTVGVGAVLANTSLDQDFQDWYRDDVRSSGTNDVSNVFRQFGYGEYTIPAMGAAWLVGEVFHMTPVGATVGEWGERGVRAVLVGAPTVLVLQWALGSSRPYETTAGSRWKPFDDTNAVSGHAFIGAIPFLTAAAMSDNILWKATMLGLSVLPAWSRVNDNAHFLSQALMGYSFACLSVWAVDMTERGKQPLSIVPLAFDDAVGLGLVWRI